MRYRILVTDEIDPEGVALLAGEESFEVDELPTMPPAELLERIPAYDALVGRSATKVSAELLRTASRLKVVGRAGVGVDNIALGTATELGIAIINAPAGNTIAVAELFFGVVLALLRHLPRAYESMHAARWERSSLLGHELKGKTLGIVGVGRIGGEVATRATCDRKQVGCVLVKDKYIIATGYNGTPMGVANCADGGCPRCASDAPPGAGYDTCVCVHAEQNAIVLAARHGNATDQGLLYTTLRPCFGCAKEAIQAGIREIVFEDPYAYQPELERHYRRLIQQAGLTLRTASSDTAAPRSRAGRPRR